MLLVAKDTEHGTETWRLLMWSLWSRTLLDSCLSGGHFCSSHLQGLIHFFHVVFGHRHGEVPLDLVPKP